MCRFRDSLRWLAVPLVSVGMLGVPLSFATAEDKTEDKSASKPEVVVKRSNDATDDDLRKQLHAFREMGFDKLELDGVYAYLASADRQAKADRQNQTERVPADFGPRTFEMRTGQRNRSETSILPWINKDTELTKEEATTLGKLSILLHSAISRDTRGEAKSDFSTLRKVLSGKEWTTPSCVPALTQILCVQQVDARILMVDTLAKIEGEKSSVALAKLAIYDLSPKVREKAVQALAGRPAAEYTPILMSAFRYPWPTIAAHAGEAVAALKRVDLTPELVNLLKEPDPTLPVKTETGHAVKEVVKINHLANCVLCHAPSLGGKDDLIRASIVQPHAAPPSTPYYRERESLGSSIRAEQTHLRQDFSVVQPVENPGKWPAQQRYDYVVRTRMLSAEEQTAFEKAQAENPIPKPYPQQGSVVFALRELTGKNPGTTYEAWIAALPVSTKSNPPPKE